MDKIAAIIGMFTLKCCSPLLALITKFSIISLMVLDRYFLSQIIKRESHFGENLIVYAKSYTSVIALCSKAHHLDH